MSSHHVTDETLQEYACGLLNMPMETLIACHLTVCAECRVRANLADAIGGASLTDQDQVPMKASALDIIALDKVRPVADDITLPTAVNGVPRPLGRLLPVPLAQLPWKTFAPGMKQYNLGSNPRKKGIFKLLSLEPGSKMSTHSHGYRELTFIISGAYADEFGRYEQGDIADLSAEHYHTPIVDSDVPCVSLIATDAPIKFNRLVDKVIQRLIGM